MPPSSLVSGSGGGLLFFGASLDPVPLARETDLDEPASAPLHRDASQASDFFIPALPARTPRDGKPGKEKWTDPWLKRTQPVIAQLSNEYEAFAHQNLKNTAASFQAAHQILSRTASIQSLNETSAQTSREADGKAEGKILESFGKVELDMVYALHTNQMVRGWDDKDLLDFKKEMNLMRAQQRRDATRSYADQQRRQARKQAKGNRLPVNMQSQKRLKEKDEADSPEKEELDENTQQASTKGQRSLNHVMFDTVSDEEISTTRTALRRIQSDLEGFPEGSIESPRGAGRMLSTLSLKSARKERMKQISMFGKESRKNDRMKRLLETRKGEFEQMPSEVQETLRKAFQSNDVDNSGALDPGELVLSLGNLGIFPKTKSERRELLTVCNEVAVIGDVNFITFVFEVVPQARQRLAELRKGHLFNEFNSYDQDRSGFLDEDECRAIFNKLCTRGLDQDGLTEMSTEFDIYFDQYADSDGQVDFEGFQHLVALSREYHHRLVKRKNEEIYEKFALSPTIVGHLSDELILLYDSFRRADESGDGDLDWQEIGSLLIEYGLMPRDEESQVRVHKIFSEADADGSGSVGFVELLILVKMLRSELALAQEKWLRESFEHFDKDSSSSLDVSEVTSLLHAMHLQPKTREEQLELKRLLGEMDSDQSGDLSFNEFLFLVQRLQELHAMDTRRHQLLTATRLGLEPRQVMDLRQVFFSLDEGESGYLNTETLEKALRLLQRQRNIEYIEGLVDKIDHLYNEDDEMILNFDGFLQLYSQLG